MSTYFFILTFKIKRGLFYKDLSIDVDSACNWNNNMKFKISGVPIRVRVHLHIIPNRDSGIGEIRFRYKDELVNVQNLKGEFV